MKRVASALLAVLLASPLPAQPSNGVPQPPPGDYISQGLWWLYQLQYERAHDLFAQHAKEQPKDPAAYFYMAATDWWHLAQDFDYKLPDIEKRFEEAYQQTVTVAKEAYERANDPKEKAKACLYWGGAEGLKGRWLVTQKDWLKAYRLGKRGNALLHKALRYDPTLYDAYMGIGIYDYFTDTLGGIIGVLSALFIRGDRERGIKELHWAMEKGERSRIESMIFLIEIYTSEEETPEKALPLAQALRKEFPHSPAMQLAHIMTLYGMKQWNEVKTLSQDFLQLSKKNVPYFTEHGIRPALYCIGVSEFWGTHNLPAARAAFDEIIAMGNDSSRFVTFALLRRGQLYDLHGERPKALEHYQAVLNRQDFWGAHKEARKYQKEPFRW